ncbi:unnamed protein product [Pleuronectes platessa]|uniref:Uncharacterized protein n=1 Tax=Pleuronectes platessa TaxID=8262 RepID=A0A9N7YGG0_PLEPL|nr:unnamed protein product [Pleuronectes platessa]
MSPQWDPGFTGRKVIGTTFNLGSQTSHFLWQAVPLALLAEDGFLIGVLSPLHYEMLLPDRSWQREEMSLGGEEVEMVQTYMYLHIHKPCRPDKRETPYERGLHRLLI